MTREEVIRIAGEVGAYRYENRYLKYEPTHTFTVEKLEAFAKLIAAAEQKRIEELENFLNEINHRLNWVKDECAVYPDNADEKAFAARIMSVLVREFPNNLVMSYREIASDYQHCANQLAAAQKRIELYEQALKASWPDGAVGDAFDYWNAARREDV